jgi:hypothetical protein
MAKLIKPTIIYSEERTGKGVDGDPVRLVRQWFSGDGTLLLSYDGYKDETYGAINMVDFLSKLSNQN